MPPGTTSHPRTASRKRALEVLFAADTGGDAVGDLLAREQRVDKAAREIAEGVAAHAGDIDALIKKYAEHWTLERMPAVDRNLLRIGVYELVYAEHVPPGAAINDLVDLAKLMSTADSGRFVNALLGRVHREAASERS